MPTTTIKVDSATRDRLAHLARVRGTANSVTVAAITHQLALWLGHRN